MPYYPFRDPDLRIIVTTSGTSAQLLDSWSLTSYRSAKYDMAIKDTAANNYMASKFEVMQDDGGAYITEYAQLVSNTNPMATVSANANTTVVRVWVTPVSTGTTVTLRRVILSA